MNNNEGKTTLAPTEGGIWRIRSTSNTVCYLDLDRFMLLRDRGPGSPVFPYDGEWVPLVEICSPRGDDSVRVGDRHEFTTAPKGSEIRWWVPRVCVAIEPVDPAEVLSGRPADE